jgi:hypothetical protein
MTDDCALKTKTNAREACGRLIFDISAGGHLSKRCPKDSFSGEGEPRSGGTPEGCPGVSRVSKMAKFHLNPQADRPVFLFLLFLLVSIVKIHI